MSAPRLSAALLAIAGLLAAPAAARRHGSARPPRPDDPDPPAAVAQRLVAAGAIVVLADARSGDEIYSGGAVDEPLPPGSIIKLLVALAAGAELPAALARPRLCPPRPPGSAPGPADGHGVVDLEDALARSCNRYFALLGRDLGAARILRTAADLGLMMAPPPPGVPPGELALGTGLRLSARQLLRLLRAVAPAGPDADAPRLPAEAVSGDEAPSAAARAIAHARQRVRAGLCRAVSAGTARAAADEGTSACGKTGTAVLGAGFIGWFVGYTPAVAPRLLVVIGWPGKLGREAARAAHPVIAAATRSGP